MDEFAETKGFTAEADGGFEGGETVVEGVGGGYGVGGDDDFGCVTADFEEFVDAVTFCEVGFEVDEEVAIWFGWGLIGFHGGDDRS